MASHFVAVMAFSRVLSGTYMWYAHSEITCEPWIGDFNHAGYAILAAHAVHLLLLGDFAYFYGKNLAALSTGNVHGISAKCLQLDAFAIACWLASTMWLQGY